MTGGKSSLALLAAGVALVVGLPLAARWLRTRDSGRCALDGLKVEALYQVRVVDAGGASRRFCCVRCAERWLALGREAAAVYITDEATGDEVEAGSAWFVVSPVATNPITRNRVHAFRDRADAEAHARDFHGLVLSPADRPLRAKPYPDRN
jgi:hypothetical protein